MKHKFNATSNVTWCKKTIDGLDYVSSWSEVDCPQCIEAQKKGWYKTFINPERIPAPPKPDMEKLKKYWENRG